MRSQFSIFLVACLFLSGCSTVNSLHYKASIENTISIHESLGIQGKKVRITDISLADGVKDSLICRLRGPVEPIPGKSLSEYIKDAFKEELFKANVYSPRSEAQVKATIKEINFSSVSPAYWKISMDISSNYSDGYNTSIKYYFDTSFIAHYACENVTNAFGPAVQELLNKVVSNPRFSSLAN